MELWVAAILTAYLAVLLAVRIRWGIEGGRYGVVVSALAFCVVMVPRALSAPNPLEGPLAIFVTVLSVGFLGVFGLLFGILLFVVVALVVEAVDFLDRLMQRKTAGPMNGQGNAPTTADHPPRNGKE